MQSSWQVMFGTWCVILSVQAPCYHNLAIVIKGYLHRPGKEGIQQELVRSIARRCALIHQGLISWQPTDQLSSAVNGALPLHNPSAAEPIQAAVCCKNKQNFAFGPDFSQ